MIVSLFDYTGIWSQPYVDAGYDVMRVDIQNGRDIYTTPMPDSAHGIIIQPPCTHFSSSGAQWWKAKDADGRTADAVRLVRLSLKWVDELEPAWWVLENPVGRIQKLIPELGKPAMSFHPYMFGDPRRKLTLLWGNFNTSLPRNVVAPQGVNYGKPDDWYSRVGGSSIRTKNYRSATSPEFARAFFLANPLQ